MSERRKSRADRASITPAIRSAAAAALVAGLVTVTNAGTPIQPQPKMGEPLLDLSGSELVRFFQGKSMYIRTLQEGEGLGPVFNKASCGNCHSNPIGGPGSQTVTRFGQNIKGSGFTPLDNLGGSLLQAESISPECAEVIPSEANVMTPRVTPGAMGYGLIEAIPDADILVNETSPPGGVSGKSHMVEPFEDPGNMRVGRFGWKAQVATILTFSADAAQNEMGLTNRFVMTENDPNGINAPDLADCDTVDDPEDNTTLGNGMEFIDRVTDFQRFLTNPPQAPKSGMSGETVFNNIGCADCHTPSFTTSNDPSLESAIRNKVIRPYTDFLLHDMGVAGGDIPQGVATADELKTPPLWGVRTRDPMWHDATIAGGTFAERVNAAITAHGAFGSEAVPSFTAWDALTGVEKDQLVAFLDSLGRLEFDFDGNEEIVLDDFLDFNACYTGPGMFYSADDPCAIHDIDCDGDVDIDDLESFLIAYDLPIEDCNMNGTPDFTDIVLNASYDANTNGVADECEACAGDFDFDGDVDFDNLAIILGVWGACPASCPQDLANADEMVNFDDLAILLGNWGPCVP